MNDEIFIRRSRAEQIATPIVLKRLLDRGMVRLIRTGEGRGHAHLIDRRELEAACKLYRLENSLPAPSASMPPSSGSTRA